LIVFGAAAILAGYVFAKKRFEEIQHSRQMDADRQLIQELSTNISSILDMNSLYSGIMNAFVRAGKVNKASLMILSEDTGYLEIVKSVGLPELTQKVVKLKVGEGLAGKVAATGKAILFADITKTQEYLDFSEDPIGSRPRETMLCLPLKFQEKIIGVVNLQSKITKEPFIYNDEVLLSIIANQAAVAINNARMYEMTITDGLTKIYIHRYFQIRLTEELERAKRYGKSVSLLMLDLDHFKDFNDDYGHQVGDYALIVLANTMKQTTRATDICCRYGGEEFSIIMPETNLKEAVAAAERLRKTIEKTPLAVRSSVPLHVTVSIGVTTYPFINPEKDISKEEFIQNSDQALYFSKKNGRNRVSSFEADIFGKRR
jgi:diguanylate cyclase (GGDEF)-like protein